VFNKEEDYGWEYVWHCHILGHEENDFMRPFVFNYWDDKQFQKNADGSFVKDLSGNRIGILNLNTIKPASLTDLTASGNVLTWSDPTPASAATTLGNPRNEIGYHIVRTSPDGTITKLEAVANATSFTDASLANVSAGAFQYTVTPYNQMGAAGILNPGGVTTTNGGNSGIAVSATGVTALTTATTATVAWTNPNTGSTTAAVTVTPAAGASVSVSGNGASVTGLTPNTAYTFSVVLTGTNGNPAAPATATATTDAISATAVTAGVVTANSAVFAWTNTNPGATTTALTVTPSLGVIVTRNGNAGATLTGLTANTTYVLDVVVKGTNNVVTAPATGGATTNALSVTGVAVSGVTATGANVAWVNPVTGGTPTVSVLPATPGILVTTGTATASVIGLIPATNYSFSVINTGTNGVAVSSATVAARTPAMLTPATNVIATMTANNQLVLAWTDNAIGETGYQVQMQVQGNNNAPWVTLSTIAGVAGNGSTATTAVTPAPAMRENRVYNFRVIAVDGAVVGTASVVATINLNIQPNTLVIGAVTAGVGSATVTWLQPSNNTSAIEVQSRRVRRDGSTTGWNNLATLAGNATSYTNTGLAAGTVVQYRVRASNPRGNTNWSAASASVIVQ
jgi:hypothetical protein